LHPVQQPWPFLGTGSGAAWRMAVVLHDRDDAAGTPIPAKSWPEALSAESPATWGYLALACRPTRPLPRIPGGSITIRHKLGGAAVTDAAVGGYTVCGANLDFWTQWGETNESDYSAARDRFNAAEPRGCV